ncbi:MAG TPA: SIS domain-containing protein [Candidatus Kapabacteria bacterium]|nr:SIS domain-containing protein [Candidatus Kapabacteria bacterium]
MKKFDELIETSIHQSIDVKKRLLDECKSEIETCGNILAAQLFKRNKIMFCGNGGSAADCQHLAAELVVRLRSSINRPALAAIALTVDTSIITAGGNDIGFDNVFARSVEAIGRDGDVLVAITTSGNSENIIRAVEQAKKQNVLVIGLLGNGGGKVATMCDANVIVPSSITARVQESHILVGHIWCEMIEEILFPEYVLNKN